MTERRLEFNYVGPLEIRPIGRGIVLPAATDQPHIDDWLEQGLSDAGVLQGGDEWLDQPRVTRPVRLRLTIELIEDAQGPVPGALPLDPPDDFAVPEKGRSSRSRHRADRQ